MPDSPAPHHARHAPGAPGSGAGVALLLVASLVAGCGPEMGAAATPDAIASPGAAASASLDPAPSRSPAPSPSLVLDPSPSPSPSAVPSPDPSPSPSPSPAAAVPYRMDLYRASAFATQANLLYCVVGASEIMVNLVTGGRDHGRATQDAMYAYGLEHLRDPANAPGLDPDAWVAVLERWGAPGYAWHSYKTLTDAIHHAAQRMRITGKPVGLYVGKHKEHAWVITGFRATADPAKGPFRVTSVAIAGPLWPMQKYYLGYYDLPPDTWLTPAKLAPAVRPFAADPPTIWDGTFVTIEP